MHHGPGTTSPAATGRVLFDRDGRAGFRATGPDPDWQIRPIGPLPLGDAVVRTTAAGLVVQPEAIDPDTGTPAFAYAAGPGGPDDHLKWCALAARTASSGMPGFDAPATGGLTGTAELSVRVFNAGRHPFGDAVTDPEADVRLGAGALLALDRETGLVFDFFLTNRRVYAVYERMRPPGADWAAFTYAVPVADRGPGRTHRLGITLDRAADTVHWTVDGGRALSAGRLGLPSLAREHLVIDHGGTPRRATPRQLTFGLGLFALLDAAGADGRGLVRLSADPYTEPVGFRYEQGRREHRLWGQGVRLTLGRLTVTTTPAR
ncbi:DUF6081 family protein [Streptomyces sp. ISL-11]|uniref:DUF6081 family protein n=1 Tax=Streptomyces sp. ISL-11 TaxID=2819174 RepID=UPI001BE84C40|nr:DUF6081 family protein [Streptomyces sp. ISL-11]MBT2383945.1 hypothetical protein [Streptomyces sp. ISL-11]